MKIAGGGSRSAEGAPEGAEPSGLRARPGPGAWEELLNGGTAAAPGYA